MIDDHGSVTPGKSFLFLKKSLKNDRHFNKSLLKEFVLKYRRWLLQQKMIWIYLNFLYLIFYFNNCDHTWYYQIDCIKISPILFLFSRYDNDHRKNGTNSSSNQLLGFWHERREIMMPNGYSSRSFKWLIVVEVDSTINSSIQYNRVSIQW